MLKQIRKSKAQSTIEYMVLVVFIIGSLIVFQKYVLRAFSGRWKSVGDTLGTGRLYQFNKTLECAFDFIHHNVWYNAACYDEDCDCLTIRANAETCQDCISNCQTPMCDD